MYKTGNLKEKILYTFQHEINQNNKNKKPMYINHCYSFAFIFLWLRTLSNSSFIVASKINLVLFLIYSKKNLEHSKKRPTYSLSLEFGLPV